MDNAEKILKIFTDTISQIKEDEKNYTFFNKDDFQKRFKNLLAFVCCIGSPKESISEISVREVDYLYFHEKYEYYISNKSITDDEKEKVILFATTIKKIRHPDALISHWNSIFGKDDFFNISIEPNYRVGLHPVLRERIFNVYMNNLFNKSKRYKIWKLLKNEKGS